MDAVGFSGVIELHRAEEVPVIGHSHGRHFLLDHEFHQLVDLACAIEQRIVGVAMQVDEGHRALRLLARGGCLTEDTSYFTLGLRLDADGKAIVHVIGSSDVDCEVRCDREISIDATRRN